jgi:hypothetical protein
MAVPAFVLPVLKIISTGFSISWTYISGMLRRQKTALEAAKDAREIDGDVARMSDDAVRDELRERARKRNKQ